MCLGWAYFIGLCAVFQAGFQTACNLVSITLCQLLAYLIFGPSFAHSTYGITCFITPATIGTLADTTNFNQNKQILTFPLTTFALKIDNGYHL